MAEILVSENITGEAMTRLDETHDVAFEPDLWQNVEELARQLHTARAIIVRNQTKVTRELIKAAPNLQIIARAGAGLDNIDTEAASEAGIVVSYTPSENSISVAELVLGFMLTAVRRIPTAWLHTRSGGWNRMQFVGGELFGKTLGIVGLGRIGRLVAERALAFGMTIIAHDEFIDPSSPFVADLGARLTSLDDLLTQSDFVSVHVPLTPDTRNCFSSEAFQKMKSSAWFMNASRGEVVDEAALLQALNEKTNRRRRPRCPLEGATRRQRVWKTGQRHSDTSHRSIHERSSGTSRRRRVQRCRRNPSRKLSRQRLQLCGAEAISWGRRPN